MSGISNRQKQIRERHVDPTLHRQQWRRKPQTQVVPNKKAENRRNHCRKHGDDGGFVLREDLHKTGLYIA